MAIVTTTVDNIGNNLPLDASGTTLITNRSDTYTVTLSWSPDYRSDLSVTLDPLSSFLWSSRDNLYAKAITSNNAVLVPVTSLPGGSTLQQPSITTGQKRLGTFAGTFAGPTPSLDVPKNTETVLIYSYKVAIANGPPQVQGVATGINYPVTLATDITAAGPASGAAYFTQWNQANDAAVSITWPTAPGAQWYVVADNAVEAVGIWGQPIGVYIAGGPTPPLPSVGVVRNAAFKTTNIAGGVTLIPAPAAPNYLIIYDAEIVPDTGGSPYIVSTDGLQVLAAAEDGLRSHRSFDVAGQGFALPPGVGVMVSP